MHEQAKTALNGFKYIFTKCSFIYSLQLLVNVSVLVLNLLALFCTEIPNVIHQNRYTLVQNLWTSYSNVVKSKIKQIPTSSFFALPKLHFKVTCFTVTHFYWPSASIDSAVNSWHAVCNGQLIEGLHFTGII